MNLYELYLKMFYRIDNCAAWRGTSAVPFRCQVP